MVNLIVALDAGHGWGDTGAINSDLKVFEADLNLEISQMLVRQLSDACIDVRAIWHFVSPNTEILTLLKRADILNKLGDICVSIHCNAYHDTQAHGWEIWCLNQPRDVALATHIATHYAKLPFTSRGIKHPESGQINIIGRTSCPTALIELGFITNPEDLPNLLSFNIQTRIAKDITKGIIDYAKYETGNIEPVHRPVA